MKKQLILPVFFLIFSLTSTSTLAEQKPCYVVVENPGSYENLVVTSITLTMIRQFVDSGVQPFPTSGISEKECMYRINVVEKEEGIKVFIFGDKISAYGSSNLRGEAGLEQGVLRAIYRSLTNNSKISSMCQNYGKALEKECQQQTTQTGGGVQLTDTQPSAQMPQPQQNNQFQQPMEPEGSIQQNQCKLQLGPPQQGNNQRQPPPMGRRTERRRPPQQRGGFQQSPMRGGGMPMRGGGMPPQGQGPMLLEYRHSSPSFAICYPDQWKAQVRNLGTETIFNTSGGRGRPSMVVIVRNAKPGLNLRKNIIKALKRFWNKRMNDIKRIEVDQSEMIKLRDGTEAFFSEFKISLNNRNPLVSAQVAALKEGKLILVVAWGPERMPRQLLKDLTMTLQLKP